MTYHSLNTALNILLFLGGLLSLYAVYFVCIALFGLKKHKKYPMAPAQMRFAILIPARNEELVVGHLIDSLKAQNYPKELYTIFCAPNNCTDNTAEVATAHGASIFVPKGEIGSKGQVLHQFIDKVIAEKEYDYVCVFDADNLADPSFLQSMNNAAVSGIEVGVGYRDSKNPIDTATSTCSSIAYWMLDSYYNGGREKMSLSSLVHGCGFIASVSLLEKLGGWNTLTMTEDYEFSAQCVLAGVRVRYIPEAIFYDEQPIRFIQSWKQQRRWSTGYVQGMDIYLKALWKKGLRDKSFTCIDMAITFLQPLVNLASMVLGGIIALLSAYRLLEFRLVPATRFVLLAAGYVLLLSAVTSLIAFITVKLSMGKRTKGTLWGIATFTFFVLSRGFIGVISLFKQQTKWEAIPHSITVSYKELP